MRGGGNGVCHLQAWKINAQTAGLEGYLRRIGYRGMLRLDNGWTADNGDIAAARVPREQTEAGRDEETG